MRPLDHAPTTLTGLLLCCCSSICICILVVFGWVLWHRMNGLGAHSNQHPAQSIKHLMLLQCQPRRNLQYVLHSGLRSCTCIICLPRDRLSFFVPAYGRTGRTDRRRGTRARARARARGRAFTVLVKAFCPIRPADTRYHCVITRWGKDLIRKASFHQPEHSEIKADPHWPAAPGNNLRSRENMWQAGDQTMNFDDEQHQDVLDV